MNEQQRQQYLGAMDIQSWFPRYALPEAKPSTICEWDWGTWPEENQQTATEPRSVTEQPTHPVPFVPLDKPIIRPSDIMRKVTPEKPENIAETTPIKAKPAKLAERFRLVTLSINTDCLMVSELPSTGMNQFTRFHEQLVRNLLFSVGISVEPELHSALFDWPIAGNRMDQDEQAAYEAVHGYLTNQFGLRRRKILFLLGRNCVRYTLGREVDFDDICGVSADDHQITVVSHSLDALMKLPSLKADTWRDISPLLTHT